MNDEEHRIQVSFFNLLRMFYSQYPEFEFIHAVPNGGKRDMVTAAKLKAEGVKAGVLDIFVPIPTKDYNGMYLETKTKTGALSTEQKKFKAFAEAQGYKVVIYRSAEAGIRALAEYLNIKLIYE